MKIVLLERVQKLGQMGDIVDVKSGYARNFLLPFHKALRATEQNIQYYEKQKSILEAKNIETRLSYPPLSKQKYLKKYIHKNLKYSESIYDKILWMPSSLNLTKKDISYICSVINE